MRRGRFTEDQIIGVLREHEAGVRWSRQNRSGGFVPENTPECSQPFLIVRIRLLPDRYRTCHFTRRKMQLSS